MLLLFLVNSSSAETFIPYTPDSLKKGDWVEIESVHYYPYVAPGIEEKVPWRAENIRRVIFRATVTDLNEHTLTLDFTLKNLYDCRNDTGKPGFYYFDSRYQQDFTFDHGMVGKRFLRVTYDRESRKAHTLDKQETTFSYSKNYVPFGVRQAGLSAYPGTLTLGQTACTGGTGYPDRLAGRRDASAGTKHAGHRRLVLPSSEYGIYV